jgi:hypothetical protein
LHPYRDLLKGENTVQTKEYKVQEVKSRNKERKEKNEAKQKDYNIFCIHRSKVTETLVFALRDNKVNSFLKNSLTA